MNHIKRVHCVQVVLLCVLYMKLKEAYKNSNSSLSLTQCLENECQTSQMCYYWHMLLSMEILIYIRSLRETNFELHVESLRSLVKGYFALDKSKYARWMTAHLFDLTQLPFTCPAVYEKFCD